MSKVYVGDVGTVIRLDVGEDVSGSTVSMKVRKPDGTETAWSASVNASDSTKIDHTTVSGDLDQAGVYELQASIDGASWDGLGETTELMVHEEWG